jgi:hypothetical protein
MAVTFLAAIAATGCQGGPSKRTLASADPALSPRVEGETPMVVESPSSPSVAFVGRHPMLYKPREYYDNTSSNKVVKTAAAVVVGVPVGIFDELKQIVVGAPPASQY